MSEFKGTPGPWEARLIHGDLHVIRSGSFRKEGVTAVSYQPVVDAIDDADDANLIAAAPELLEALLDLKFKLYGSGSASPKIEQVIKKALGQ